MTTLIDTRPQTILVRNDVFDMLTTTLVSMREQNGSQALSDLADAFTAAKGYKGHSRNLVLDEGTATALRSVFVQSDVPESRAKTVTDKLDAAFPQTATAVVDRSEAVEDEVRSDTPSEGEQTEVEQPQREAEQPQTAPAESGEPQQPVVAPNAPRTEVPPSPNVQPGEPNAEGVFHPDNGRTTIKAIKFLPERVSPNVSETALIVHVGNMRDFGTYPVIHGKDGTVRYRSKSRKSGGSVSLVDLAHLSAADLGITFPEQANGAKAVVVCEVHARALPIPSVDSGKFYVHSPERFCRDCASVASAPKPERAEPARRGRKPQAEQPVALAEHVKVVEQPTVDGEVKLHPSDEKASEDDWNAFSQQLAAAEGATVMWTGSRQYALNYGDGKTVDVYVNAQGVENRWRVGESDFESLTAAKAALPD